MKINFTIAPPKSILDGMCDAINSGEPDIIVSHTYDTFTSGVLRAYATVGFGIGLAVVYGYLKSKGEERSK